MKQLLSGWELKKETFIKQVALKALEGNLDSDNDDDDGLIVLLYVVKRGSTNTIHIGVTAVRSPVSNSTHYLALLIFQISF